jgi:hypothetical protein
MTNEIEKNVAALQRLFVLSQTESLMLDDGNFEAVERLAGCKAEIVGSISASSSGAPDDAGLRRDALELISRITAIDAKNRLRLEQWKSEALSGLQQIHDERHLMNTYSAG